MIRVVGRLIAAVVTLPSFAPLARALGIRGQRLPDQLLAFSGVEAPAKQ